MFQQSFVGSGRRSWSFAVSLLAQTALLGAVLLATLLYTPLLPAARFAAVFLEPPPPPPGPPPPPPKQVAVTRPRTYTAELRMPDRIPEKVAILEESPEAPRLEPSYAGVPHSTGPGVESGVIGSFSTNVPPPKPPAPVVESVAEPAPAPSGPARVGGDVQAAKLIRRVEPVYPDLAIKTRTSGKVRLRAVISPDGAVEELSVIGGHPLLIRAAVDAVRQWRYRPTVLNGTPVQVLTEIEVNFVLR